MNRSFELNLRCFAVFYTSWLPEVQNIYYQGCRRKLVPTSSNMPKLLSFFNCAAALMTSKLQNLAIDSMSDYTHLISPDPVGESVKTPARQMHEQVDT